MDSTNRLVQNNCKKSASAWFLALVFLFPVFSFSGDTKIETSTGVIWFFKTSTGHVSASDTLIITLSDRIATFSSDTVGFALPIKLTETTEPTSASAPFIYVKSSDGLFYFKNSSGTEFDLTAAAAGSQTPWIANIDADGFDLQDLSNIEFRTTTGAPASSVQSIWADVGGVNLNVPTGDIFDIFVNGVSQLTISSTVVNAVTSLTEAGNAVPNSTNILDFFAETSLADPNADRIVFWDDSDTQHEYATLGNGISITTNDIAIDHDAADNFVANEHINHTSVTLTAGTNLSGGGDLSANRTFNVDDAFLVNDAADEMLLADATTNVVTDILDLSHTGGTVAAGFGTGIRFNLEDAGGIEEQASIDVSLDVVTDGAEEASIIFRHNVAGTMQESMRIDGTAGFVGIGTTNPQEELHVVGEIFLDHTATAADEHALEIDVDAAGFGDIKGLEIEYDTGPLSSGEVAAVILVNINEIDAVGGDVIGLEILSTDGGADNIVGIKIGAEIAPLIQDSGTFINSTLGTNNTNTTNVPDMVDGSTGTNTTIFGTNNFFIIIGSNTANTEIEVVIETGFGGPGIQPVFAYSTSGTNQFTNFTPTDGSNGFKNAGAFVIAWDADEVPGYVADDVTGEFDIRITRTANPAGSVSLFYAKTASTRTFGIDINGNVRFLTYIFEGATDDAFEHTLNVIDPTADRLFNFPDDQLVAGDVLVASDASDLEYLNLANNQLLFGDGAGIPTAAVLSGDVTNVLGVVTIAAAAVDNSMHANMAQNTIKMRVASGPGDPEDIDISAGLPLVTAVSGDFIVIEDATDGNLKRADAGDFLGGGVTYDAIGDAAGNGSIGMGSTEQIWVSSQTDGDVTMFTLDINQVDDADATDDLIAWSIDATSESGDAGDTFTVMRLLWENGTANTILDRALLIDNAETTASTMQDAIQITSTGVNGGIVNALNLSAANITNWADIGANDLITSTATISSAEIDRLDGLTSGIIDDDQIDTFAELNTIVADRDLNAVLVADNESSSETNAIVFLPGGDLDGGILLLESDGDLNYNPSTGTLTTTEFVGGGVGITGVTASHAGTITWTGTSILESGVAFGFGDGSDATLTHTYANTGTDVVIAYSTAAMAVTGALTATNLSGTNTGDQTINTADIGDVSVTQTELAELQTIGEVTISATQWATLGGGGEFKVERYLAGFANPDAGDLAAMAALATFDNTTNDVSWEGLAADAAADEFCTFTIPMPEDWDGSTDPEFQLTAFTRAVDASDDVVWQIQAAYVRPGTDVFTGAYGTAASVTDTYGTVDRPERSGTFSPSPAGTPAAGAWLFVRINRDADNGSDDLSVDIILTALFMEYAAVQWPVTSQF